ncbi:SPOR domain-containing protein [Egbenema bharatensis]|uniref:SPOR domain-containing protein n=1 Tax=Egbenema bharatensis TaxID=3463334 RepID=UPI003A87003B
MKVSSAIPRLVAGLIGSGLLITPQLASANVPASANELEGDRLLAQQIVDGLPPPPPLDNAPGGFPSHPTSGNPGASQYLVIVNGDSPLLLSQVQMVAANASLQDYNGQRFIQAGLFNDPAMAQQQVSALAAQGIGAEIVTVNAATTSGQVAQQNPLPGLPPPDILPVAPVPREVEFGQPPSPNQLSNPVPPSEVEATAPIRNSRHYYVVIPGSSNDIEAITNQVARLGEGFDVAQMVQTAESRRGTHVRVGPFADRSAANRWSRYFRDFGMDARVYFSR